MADRRFWKYSEILLWRMYFKMNMAGGQISEHSETIANEKWCDRTLDWGGILATTPAGVAFSSGRGWKVRTHFNYSCLTAGLTVLAQLCRLRIPHTPRRPLSACVLKHGLGRIYHKFFFALPPGSKIFQLPPSQSLLERPRGIPGGLSSAPQCPVLRAAVAVAVADADAGGSGSASASSKSLELMPHKVSFRLAAGRSVLCFVINTNTHTRTPAHAHRGSRTNTLVSAVHAPTHRHTHGQGQQKQTGFDIYNYRKSTI